MPFETNDMYLRMYKHWNIDKLLVYRDADFTTAYNIDTS